MLTALAAYLVLNNSNSTLNVEKTSFAVEDTASISKIFMADKSGHSVTLKRISSGEWKVNDNIDARQDALNTLLATIKKVEMKAPIGINARENILKDLAARAIKVEIYQNDKLSKVYYVGGPTPDNSGTYMAIEDDGEFSDPYITYLPGFFGYLTTRYIVLEYKWRTTAIFNSPLSEISDLKVEYFDKDDDSFQITEKDNGTYILKSLKFNTALMNFDTVALKEYLVNYRNVHFEAFEKLKEGTRDSVLATQPYFRISLTNKKGKTNSVTGFRIKALPGSVDLKGKPIEFDTDRMYGKINEEPDLALIQYLTFDNLLKPLSWFEIDPRAKKRNGEKE